MHGTAGGPPGGLVTNGCLGRSWQIGQASSSEAPLFDGSGKPTHRPVEARQAAELGGELADSTSMLSVIEPPLALAAVPQAHWLMATLG